MGTTLAKKFAGVEEEQFLRNDVLFRSLSCWEFSLSSRGADTPWRFWCIPFCLAEPGAELGTWREGTPDFVRKLTVRAATLVAKEFPDHHLGLNRCMLNGKTYGQDGSIHADNSTRERREVTVVYFPVANWKREWGAELLFYDETGEEVLQTVPYTPNAFFVFDAAVPHCGYAPQRVCPELKITMVWNFVEQSWLANS